LLLILVVGMPGAGKSLVVEVARNEFNLPTYTMGDVVREEAVKRYGSITPAILLKTSRELREAYGLDYVAVKTMERIDKKAEAVVIDGVRSLHEVEYFSKHGDTVIVAVHASPRTRFARLLKRGREGDPGSWEEFVKRDRIELDFGIGEVIALADYIIVNEAGVEDAKREIRKTLETILGGRR